MRTSESARRWSLELAPGASNVAHSSTCAWIQEVYGIDNATLWSNNPQIDAECSNIYIGEVLCVDTNTFDYPEFNQTRYDVGLLAGCRTWNSTDARPSHTRTSRTATSKTFDALYDARIHDVAASSSFDFDPTLLTSSSD